MSRHARRPHELSGWFTACMLLLPPWVGAQTIADYSRAQRALLENAMTQAAARSAGMGASGPAPGPAMATSVAAPSATPAPRTPLPPTAPAVLVSGVFASRDGAIAEVIVDATPYLLSAGQGVPGTLWRVEAIAIDRVVLSRHGGVVAAVDAEAARKVFALPALPTPR
jgi:type IV pilus biogenesis protein PilP